MTAVSRCHAFGALSPTRRRPTLGGHGQQQVFEVFVEREHSAFVASKTSPGHWARGNVGGGGCETSHSPAKAPQRLEPLDRR